MKTTYSVTSLTTSTDTGTTYTYDNATEAMEAREWLLSLDLYFVSEVW